VEFAVWLIILLIAAIVNVNGKAKKKRQTARRQPMNRPIKPAENFEEDDSLDEEEYFEDETQEEHEKAIQPVKPSLKPIQPDLVPMIDKQDFPPQTKPKATHPKVHVHTAEPCPVDGGLQGSLNYDSPEGLDSCHEEMLHPADRNRRNVQEQQPDNGFQLDFSPNALVQAVVMQEILTRPCDRRRR
jgi:hypothetical protein